MFITNVSQADKGEYYVVVTPTQDEDTHISTFTQQIFFDVYGKLIHHWRSSHWAVYTCA